MRARVADANRVLPVLQTFEQIGFPVRESFVRRQLEVYREFWPSHANGAAFAWDIGPSEPMRGLAERPALARAVRGWFGAAASRPVPCTAQRRAVAP